MLLDHCYPFGLSAVAFPSEEEVSRRRGPPVTYFGPALDPPLGGSGRKNNNTCKGPWVLHPYQVSSKSIKQFWRSSRKCEKFTDGRRTPDDDDDDGRTDDGRCAMTIAHSSLRLRWANKKKCNGITVFHTKSTSLARYLELKHPPPS